MKFIFITLTLCLALWADIGPEDVTYMTENYPPQNYQNEFGIVKGLSVTLLKEMWKEMGCPEQKIHVYPWARGYLNIKTREKQCLFTMAHTKSRDTLFKWVGPISTSSVLLVGKKNGAKIVIDSLSQLNAYKVGVIRSDAGEQMLLSKKVSPKIMVKSVDMQGSLSNLLKGEVDLICIGAQAYTKLSEQTSSNVFYNVYTVDKNEDYFAFSKDTPDELIQKFQQALDAIKTKHLQLLDSMGLRLEEDNESTSIRKKE